MEGEGRGDGEHMTRWHFVFYNPSGTQQALVKPVMTTSWCVY